MKSPFKFLDSFTKDDREIFFGREKEIEELYQRIFRSKIMLVYGVSGTGKSSLINCGLANKFRDEDWLPVNVRRGKNILENMYAAIVAASLTPKSQFAASETQFRKYVKSLYLDHYKPIYFIFDQFEELFIFGTKEEKSQFVKVIKTLVDSDIQCRFLFVMREEYMASVTEFEKHIPVFFSNRVRIENMDINNAIQAIKGPCKVANITVDEGFPEALIENLSPGSPEIELTYLQVFLDKIYHMSAEESGEGRAEGKGVSFTLEQLKKTGNVSDLLGAFLNEQISLLSDPDTALAVLKSFVSVKGTKRQMTLDEVKDYSKTLGKPISDPDLLEMLQNFVNLRILRDKDQHDRYELRHDSLATKIFEKISGVEKDILEIRQFIEDGYHNWQKRGVLFSSGDLEYIAPYESRLFLSSELLNLLSQSRNQLERINRRKWVIFVAATFVLLVAFAGFTVWALVERNISRKQEIIANANYYNALSKELVVNDPTKALRIADYACKLDPSQNNYQNLVNIYTGNEFYTTYLSTKNRNITDFKVLGKTGNIAIVENGKIQVLNTKGELVKEVKSILPQNFSFAFSPDEKYLIISSSFRDTVKIYDESFTLKSKIFFPNTLIRNVYFTSDSKIIALVFDQKSVSFRLILCSMDGNMKQTNKSFGNITFLNNLSSDTIYFISQFKELYQWVTAENNLTKKNLKLANSEFAYSGKFISKDKFAVLTNLDTIHIYDLDTKKMNSWCVNDEEQRGFEQLSFLQGINMLCTFNEKIFKFWDLTGQNVANLKLKSSTTLNFQYDKITGKLFLLLDNRLSYYKPGNLSNELILKNEDRTVQFSTFGNSFIGNYGANSKKILLTIKGNNLEKTVMTLPSDKYYFKIPGSNQIYENFSEKYDYRTDNQAIIYDIVDGMQLADLKRLNYYPINIICSNNVKLFIATGKKEKRDSSSTLWYTTYSTSLFNNSGSLLKSVFPSAIDPWQGIHFSSDNTNIVFASGSVGILQDTSGKIISRLSGHLSYIQSIDLSFDGKYLVTGANDKTARLWSRAGNLLKVIQTDESPVNVAFVPGEQVFQVQEPNSVKLYNYDGILMQKIQTTDKTIYSPENRFLFYIASDGIHRTKLKQPVDSFMLTNNFYDIAFNEKMEYNILSVKELLRSGNPGNLYHAGNYFLENAGKKSDVKEREYTINTAEKLFRKGLTYDTLHGEIARSLTGLYIMKYQFLEGNVNKEIDNCYKIMSESKNRNDLLNAFNFYAQITYTGSLDSISISYGYVDKIISLSNKLLDMFPDDISLKQAISSRCSDLSFSLLDFKQYESALSAVKLAIKADSTYPYSYSNLPLAYLFNNKHDEALKEYKKWIDKPWTVTADASTYREVFILDIEDLENRGITHPDFAKVKELLKE